MMDMNSFLDKIPLNHRQEAQTFTEPAKKYARLLNLEMKLHQAKAELVQEMSTEELRRVEETVNDMSFDDVPKYLSVAEVAAILSISPQMVRRNCANGKYKGFQPSGTNGIWFVSSDTFRKDEQTWRAFIEKRNEMFVRAEQSLKQLITLENSLHWEE
ncbi:MAG: hypothetical protein ACRC5C_09220 [Bacilli bacterium]